MNHSFSTVSRNFIFLLLTFTTMYVQAVTSIVNPVCEYRRNPLGIDVMHPRLSWQILSDEANYTQKAYEIRAAGSVNDLQVNKNLIWNTGKVLSDQSVNVEYSGPVLTSSSRMYWQVRVWNEKGEESAWSEPAYWETGILEPGSWTASWITLPDEPESTHSLPAHYYRKEFTLSGRIKSARIYASAHGLYELYLNGKKVGDQLFTPGWTSYRNHIQYQTYDVTDLVGEKNAIGALLGEGWFRGYIGFNGQRNYYGDKLALLVQMKIDFEDGSSEWLGTDGSWKVTTGAILESDIYNGELFDARLDMPGWKLAGFRDNDWSSALEADHPKNILVAQNGVPVRAIQEIRALAKIITPAKELVYDLGQNMVGHARVVIKGHKGDTATIQFAEVLDKNGNFYTDNLRSAKCTDRYVFASDGEIVYEPTFTFHGFRYVKISGVSEPPALDQVTGVVIHSDMPATGSFECSNELINQLQHNIQWGQKGNFLDVPTDCPQRDERLGWTGDAQVFSMTAGYNFNVAPFYTKWMKDIAFDQSEDGKIPFVVPDVLNGSGGATGWADVVAIIPWTVYDIYGDKQILESAYPAVTKWVGYMTSRAGDDFLWTGDNHFGDWLAFATTRSDYPGATTEKDLIATAYYYHTTMLTSRIAGILGKAEDQKKYQDLATQIKKAFAAEFITPNGRLVSHTQTAYVLALSFGLMPENLIDKAASYLAKDVEKFRHLTTGFLGTPLLCQTLSDFGYDSLAFMLVNRTEYPSWLYPVTQGATTIWERWDGQKPDGTFQDVGMNSFNHYAYGAIGQWLYSHVAGITIDENHPGYKHFVLAPHTGGEIYFANASFESMYGKISSRWREEKGILNYSIEIPANTSATVILPSAELVKVEMLPAAKEHARQVGEHTILELGSGKYSFSYPYQHKK